MSWYLSHFLKKMEFQPQTFGNNSEAWNQPRVTEGFAATSVEKHFAPAGFTLPHTPSIFNQVRKN